MRYSRIVSRTAVYVFVAAFFTSCSPQAKLERLQKKHPELFVNRIDTIRDTVISTQVFTDSVFTSRPGDTIYVSKDRLLVKYVRRTDGSNYVSGAVRADTVIVERPVFLTAFAPHKPTRWERIYAVGFWVLCAFLMLLFLFFFSDFRSGAKR